MDGGSLCQPHAAAITPAAMMDGGEGKGWGWGGAERETYRGASITSLNLPVTARASMKGGVCEGRRRVRFTLTVGQRFISFL